MWLNYSAYVESRKWIADFGMRISDLGEGMMNADRRMMNVEKCARGAISGGWSRALLEGKDRSRVVRVGRGKGDGRPYFL
jgi:hypothetical protein